MSEKSDEESVLGSLPATRPTRFGAERRKSSGKIWTYPAIADGHLYLRDQEYIFCYKIKK